MPRDCRILGHVQVDDDARAECLCCGTHLTPEHRITIHVARYGELTDPADTATTQEWGHGGTAPT